MSRYSGNSDECPHCGLTYGEFRTGLNYQTVYLMLPWELDPSDGINKRRGTVLGKWFQIKQEQWRAHLADCEEAFRSSGES